MAVDSQGLSLTGSGEAAAAYDRAVEHLIRFRPAVADAASESVAADPTGASWDGCSVPIWD